MHDSSPTGATSPLIGHLFRGCLLATGGRKRQTAVGLRVAGAAVAWRSPSRTSRFWVWWVLRLGVVAGMTELGCACGKIRFTVGPRKKTRSEGKRAKRRDTTKQNDGKKKVGKKEGKKPQTPPLSNQSDNPSDITCCTHPVSLCASNLSNGSKKIQDDVLHHPSSSNPPDRGIYSSLFISLSPSYTSPLLRYTIKFSTVGWLSLPTFRLLLVLSGGLKIQQASAQHLSAILVFSYRTYLSTAGFSPLLSPVFPSDAIFFSLGLSRA
ncbi:hypothetical protein DFP73DRAFT_250836 [Morchella snyderi]|nr:hypothetical protein DFP73DRAFT_250836 [Morchella snyderi]